MADQMLSKLKKCISSGSICLSDDFYWIRTKRYFSGIWTERLRTDARVFNGLYAGLVRVETGTAKTPHKTLKEWYDRTRYKWEGEEIVRLSGRIFMPVIEGKKKRECVRLAGLLLKAARRAGITREEQEILTLNEINANAYVELNGEELYVDDKVEIKLPAWYQNGTIIEQGSCVLVTNREDE